MFERFTERARRVVVMAQEEARMLGHGWGVAAQVLVKLGADLSRVRQQVVRLLAGRQGEDVTGEDSPLPDDAPAYAGSLERRLAAIERWIDLRPGPGDLEDPGGLEGLDGEIARVRGGEGSRDRPSGFRGFCRAARPGEAAAGGACPPGGGAGRPRAAGPGTGPGEGRGGQAAGCHARARHRSGRRHCIGAMRWAFGWLSCDWNLHAG